nr:hypothetical protein [uncultured Draconibacterium sp.]
MKTLILKNSLIGILTFLILGATSCNEENYTLDKSISFSILDDHYGYGSGNDTTLYSSSLIDFNINDYILVDSVLFTISDLTTKSITDGSDISATVSVELFDLTNNTVIQNSKIVSDDIKASRCKLSSNLLSSFPDESINIGIRIINNDKTNCSWELHAASLILKRE